MWFPTSVAHSSSEDGPLKSKSTAQIRGLGLAGPGLQGDWGLERTLENNGNQSRGLTWREEDHPSTVGDPHETGCVVHWTT